MLDTQLSIYLLEYSAGTRSRSQDYSAEVSFSSNLSFFWGDTSHQTGYFCPLTLNLFLGFCPNSISGVLPWISMEFVNSASSPLLFEEIHASPFTTSSIETTYFTALILWELCESISKWRTEGLAPTKLKNV